MSATCLRIFAQDQSDQGSFRFDLIQQVRALLSRLAIDQLAHSTSKGPDGRIVYNLTLWFASPKQTLSARGRILLEQKGGDWTPFAVSFVSRSFDSVTAQIESLGRPGPTRRRDPLSRPLTVLSPPTAQGLLPSYAQLTGRMTSFTRPRLGDFQSAYQSAPYISRLTGHGVDTPSYEAGTFLPATPFLGGMRQRRSQSPCTFPRQKTGSLLAPFSSQVGLAI